MKTILITGIGGLTPRSIATIIRENHPDYHLIGVDINKKAVGFFMKGLLDEYYVCPHCSDEAYFPFIERLVEEKHIDYAFVQQGKKDITPIPRRQSHNLHRAGGDRDSWTRCILYE